MTSSADATAPIPMLERRRIEAAILKHVHDSLKQSHGEQIARVTLADAVRRSAVEQGAELILDALLPAAPGTRRSGAELLVRLPGGGYVPVVVVRHRVTDTGEGAVMAAMAGRWCSTPAQKCCAAMLRRSGPDAE